MPRRRILLFSPLAGHDPLGGDTSYTEALLDAPPPDVEYSTYKDAIADGRVRVRGRKPWRNPTEGLDATLFSIRLFELGLRRSRVMFREPNWFISVEPGAFDLVHQHLFSVRQIGGRLPVVSGAGYPLPLLYEAREGWSPRHASLALTAESLMARALDVHVPWLRATGDGVLTVYGENFRSWLIDRGADPRRVLISGTALPEIHGLRSRSDGRTLGIIARDFVRKGGDIALEAFRHLHHDDPTLRLLVVTTGQNARDHVAPGPGIEVMVDLDREAVLGAALPRIDILLAPTRSDCGAPYGILEALQAGTCVVTSDIPWLDNRLRPPGVRKVEATTDAVVGAVRSIMRDGLPASQAAARDLWESTFTMDALHRALTRAYDLALEGVQ